MAADFSAAPLSGSVILPVGTSTGVVGDLNYLFGQTRISQLPVATNIYLNDLVVVHQGLPPIPVLATISQFIAAFNPTVPANTEIPSVPQSQVISGIPLNTQGLNLNDWMLINQGSPPVTRRCRVIDILSLRPQPAPAPPSPTPPAPPPGCPNQVLEDFSAGAAPYTITGSNYQFNPVDTYGPSLSIPGGHITAAATTLNRSFVGHGVTQISCDVRLDSIVTTGLPDDGPVCQIFDQSSGNIFQFDSAREKFFNASQAPMILIQGFPSALIGSTHLTVGIWYTVKAVITDGTHVTVTIIEKVSGALFGTAIIVGLFTTWEPRVLEFFDSFSFGGSDTKPGATYDNIELC